MRNELVSASWVQQAFITTDRSHLSHSHLSPKVISVQRKQRCTSHPCCTTSSALLFTSICLVQYTHALLNQDRAFCQDQGRHTLLLQNKAEGSPLHLTNPDVQFFMIKTFTSGKAKCEFLAFQRDNSVFNKMLLPPPQKLILLFDY